MFFRFSGNAAGKDTCIELCKEDCMRHFGKLVTVSLAAALFTVFACAAFAAEYEWKLAHEEPENGFMDIVAKQFGAIMAEKSGGKIELVIYPAGTLGNVEDLVEQTQNNTVQFNIASSGTLSTQFPQIQVLLLQYLFPNDMKKVQKVLEEGKFKAQLEPVFESKKLVALGYVAEGWQVWTSKRPLASVKDFSNFKMRTTPSKLLVETYKAYGANPTPVEFSQVYSSLQLGTVDGQENPPYAIDDMKFYEVQDYLTFGYTSPLILTLIGNADTLSKLPPDIRAIVDEAAAQTVAYAFDCEEEMNRKALENMKQRKNSLNIVYLTDGQIAQFRPLARKQDAIYTEELGGKGAAELLKTLLEDIDAASR